MMKFRLVFVILFVLWVCSDLVFGSRAPVKLDNNGYSGLVVAVGQGVTEDALLLDRIKKVLTDASAVLFRATKYRAHFRDVTILLPSTWSGQQVAPPGGWQRFSSANVLVDVPNPATGDRPYTHRVSGCGKSGEYIHLTPEYFKEKDRSLFAYGNQEKALVHEWGHLRWGLFDEFPKPGEKQFYRYREQILPVQCSAGIRGVLLNRNTFQKCSYSPTTLEVETDCRFYPYTENTKAASMMYYQYLPSIVDFCGEEEQETLHNIRAPTEQNRKCNNRAAWGVLRQHEDFRDEKNPPISADWDTTPTFTVVQERERKISLLLDVSNSMKKENRVKKMNQAARNFISTSLPDYTYLGIVSFSGEATELSPLTLIASESTRRDLVSKLPWDLSPWTSIGAGLQMGIKQLSASGDPRGQRIMLLTDGEETYDPLISDVLPELIKHGVVVDTIGISKEASSALAPLSAATGGRNYFYSARDDDTSLDEALTVSVSEDIDASVLIHSWSGRAASSDVRFSLDSSLGRRTVITVYGDVEELSLTSPAGNDVILDGSAALDEDAKTETKQITVAGTAETGEWSLTFTRVTGSVPRVLIQSRARTLDDVTMAPVTLRSWTSQPEVKFSERDYVIVYAEVRRGYLAVLGARVTAELPTNEGLLTADLVDNGVYPDLHRGDGVYSGPIFSKSIPASGRYPVRVRLVSAPDTVLQGPRTSETVARIPRNGVVEEELEPPTPVPLTDIMRTTTAGVLKLNMHDGRTFQDVIPPSKVENLDAVKVFLSNMSIIVQWAESGDDLNSGTASDYEFRACESFDELLVNFSSCRSLGAVSPGAAWRSDGELQAVPGAAWRSDGELQAVLDVSGFAAGAMLYVAVQARDGAGNLAPVSNIEAVSLSEPSALDAQTSTDGNQQAALAVGLILLLLTLALLAILAYKYRHALSSRAGKLLKLGRVSPTVPNGTV